MKRVWLAIGALALGLWVGYDLGYHRGMRDEEAAWLGGEEVQLDQGRTQIAAVYQATVLTPNGPRRFAVPSKRASRFVYFADPRSGTFVIANGNPPVNGPDPRNTPLK